MKKYLTKIRKRLSNRRGVSLVEVVVAIVFISIISVGALTLIESHSKAEHKITQTIEATTVAENAIECFRYADGSVEEFEKTFCSIYEEEVIDSGHYKTYVVNVDGCKVTVEAYFLLAKINITATIGSEELFKTSYEK